MPDLNFLIFKAIDKAGLTPSTLLRTSLIFVLEDSVTKNSSQFQKDLGLLYHNGYAYVHGGSPSVPIISVVIFVVIDDKAEGKKKRPTERIWMLNYHCSCNLLGIFEGALKGDVSFFSSDFSLILIFPGRRDVERDESICKIRQTFDLIMLQVRGLISKNGFFDC
ncbi:unnamed protein product [Lactuca saligna]|uniref:Uncharacterized protein n=1 Tax=Lactuca saligna TaxID=75948 RepID=A0AA36E0C8_LACSI|nr:unnamed protein product [Lactuca saligna]